MTAEGAQHGVDRALGPEVRSPQFKWLVVTVLVCAVAAFPAVAGIPTPECMEDPDILREYEVVDLLKAVPPKSVVFEVGSFHVYVDRTVAESFALTHAREPGVRDRATEFLNWLKKDPADQLSFDGAEVSYGLQRWSAYIIAHALAEGLASVVDPTKSTTLKTVEVVRWRSCSSEGRAFNVYPAGQIELMTVVDRK